MAQLVAHHTGSVGVRGSSPLSSTQSLAEAGALTEVTGFALFNTPYAPDPRTPSFLAVMPWKISAARRAASRGQTERSVRERLIVVCPARYGRPQVVTTMYAPADSTG